MALSSNSEYFDVVIVGAGLSGVGAAYHLQDRCPNKSYVILEGRVSMGGTWDIFRYPGIRSDSDMYTLGYNFKPWLESKAIADGPSILRYVRETAAENDIDKNIRYGHQVIKATWSSNDAAWTTAGSSPSRPNAPGRDALFRSQNMATTTAIRERIRTAIEIQFHLLSTSR